MFYNNPSSDELVFNLPQRRRRRESKGGSRWDWERGDGTGRARGAEPMIAGEEKNMMGAQQAGRQSDRQEPALPCPALRRPPAMLVTRQIIR
jgi:hypothetical protein